MKEKKIGQKGIDTLITVNTPINPGIIITEDFFKTLRLMYEP